MWRLCLKILIYMVPVTPSGMVHMNSTCCLEERCKTVPVQPWTGPEGSRRLRLPDLKTIGTWRWQDCTDKYSTYRPPSPPPLPPRKYSFYISVRGWVDPRDTVRPRKDYVHQKSQWHQHHRESNPRPSVLPPHRVSVLSTHGTTRLCVCVLLTCSSWSIRPDEWKECRPPSHKACCCGRPSPNCSPPLVAVTVKISQPSMYTPLCNVCHVDKLTKRYSTLSVKQTKKIERPPPTWKY